jgi:hypothetical protein
MEPQARPPEELREHYVYILRRPDLSDPFEPERGRPFYIGKGKKYRIGDCRREAKRGWLFPRHCVINYLWEIGLDFQEEIYISNCTEKEAYLQEAKLISLYKTKKDGGCLTNISRGGYPLRLFGFHLNK